MKAFAVALLGLAVTAPAMAGPTYPPSPNSRATRMDMVKPFIKHVLVTEPNLRVVLNLILKLVVVSLPKMV